VNYRSRSLVSAETMLGIGRSACTALGTESKKYDVISVVNSISPIYPLTIPFYNYNFHVSGNCDSWLTNEKFSQMVSSFVP
jgi:hypothetical protein